MKKHMLILPVFLVAVVALILGAAVPDGWAQPCEGFDDFEAFIEINGTDLDAGLQGMLDGEAWYRATVSNEDDETIFSFNPDGNLGDHGVTEIQWESNEPPFHPSKEAEPAYKLSTFLALFPEETYTAEGNTVEGDCLESETELTHDLPAGPFVIQPVEEQEVVTGSDLTIVWHEVTKEFNPNDPQAQKQNTSDLASDIEEYIVVVEFSGVLNPGLPNEKEIAGTVTIEDISPGAADGDGNFLVLILAEYLPEVELGDVVDEEFEFKIEVGAKEESGNLTFTEVPLVAAAPAP